MRQSVSRRDVDDDDDEGDEADIASRFFF